MVKNSKDSCSFYVSTYMCTRTDAGICTYMGVPVCVCLYISKLCFCNDFLFIFMKIIMSFVYLKKRRSRSRCPVSDVERSIDSQGLGLLGCCVPTWKDARRPNRYNVRARGAVGIETCGGGQRSAPGQQVGKASLAQDNFILR